MAITEVEKAFSLPVRELVLPSGLQELLTPPKEIVEVTPANMAELFRKEKFADFSWLPYFSGEYAYGRIPSSELFPGERLELIIPEMVIEQRVKAFIERVAPVFLRDPQSFALGAMLEGGRYFYGKILGSVSEKSIWGSQTFPATHADIKSRWSTPSGKEEVKMLPRPTAVNEKVYVIFEGVIDSIGTMKTLQENLSESPYKQVGLVVISLTDKSGARKSEKQSLPPNMIALFGLGNFWMCGCGPDAKEGRCRILPGGGIARYYNPTE